MNHATKVSLVAVAALLSACRGAPAQAAACPAPPAAMEKITANTFHADPQSSTIDPARFAANADSVAPVKAFEAELGRLATAAQSGDRNAGDCAGDWLANWASRRAMTATVEGGQPQFVRRWATAAIAMNMIRAQPFVTTTERRQIEPWLRRLADQVEIYPSLSASRRNNHFYWSGFAVGAVGLAIEDPALIARARTAYQHSVQDIRPDGHLPREAARGVKAWQYHDFSAFALVMLAEIGAQRGENWYAMQGGALHRLVRFVLQGLHDPARVERVSGVAPSLKLNRNRLAWYPLYARRFPDRVRGFEELAQRRYWSPLAGGDMSLLATKWIRRPK